MHISGGGGSSAHHVSTHSNSHPSHAEVSHHEAPARSAPVRSTPTRRENPAPVHNPAPQHDTVHISPQAVRLEHLMQSQDKVSQSSPKPAPQPAKKESSGGFLSKLVDKVSSTVHKAELTVKNVEHTVSKEAGKVEQAVKQVVHTAENATEHTAKAVVHEAKQIEKQTMNVIQHTAHETEKVAQKAEHAVSKEINHVESKVIHETQKVEKSVEKYVQQAVHAVQKDARQIAHVTVKEVQNAAQRVESGGKHLEKRAILAYQATQQAVGRASRDVQHTFLHQAKQEAGRIGNGIEKGARNLAAHPGATASALMSVAGGAAEAAAGAAFAVATSETVVGAAVGGAVAVDGGAHTVAGIGDLASIFNGNMSKVGTHNILEDTAGRIGGQTGRDIYNVTSTTVGLVIPGTDVNAARVVLTSVSNRATSVVSAAKEFAANAVPLRSSRLAYEANGTAFGSHMGLAPARIETSSQKMLAKTEKNLSDTATEGTGNANRQVVTSNLGKEIDVTPSSNHSVTTKNLGPFGQPNSSADILGSRTGDVVTRRWYGPDGRAQRDIDFTDHDMPANHPEVPHEHTWTYDTNGSPSRH